MKVKLFLTLLFLPLLASAQTYSYSTLTKFPSVSTKSADNPFSPIIDSAGNIYGVSFYGGTYNGGTVFKVTPKGTLSVLYSFGSSAHDGTLPSGRLVRDSAGNLYGQTFSGGALGYGIVFKVTSAGKESILYSFPGEVAIYGDEALVRDSAGNLYGYYTNIFQNGSVFKLTPSGVYSTLYSFCSLSNCADGSDPRGGLVMKPNGKLYGVTYSGGSGSCRGGCGIVFELDTAGNETVLHSFTSSGDGAGPSASLLQDAAGNLYGTTYYGGLDYGTIFKVNASGQESILYEFCPDQNQCLDGEYPEAPLLRDSAGDLFGIASEGGNPIFKLTPEGVESVLHDGANAGNGYALVMDKSGNLYGTTWGGGPNHTGTVYKLTKD